MGPIAAEQREYLSDVLASSDHLLDLVSDVLDLSKVEAGRTEFRPERVNLADIIAEARDTVRVLASRSASPSRSRSTRRCWIVIDLGKLKQVLYNYLSNALKFTSEGGRVTVRAAPEGLERFRVEVEDSGVGITPEDIGRLFQEFEQLDAGKKHAGTGLGLALTRRIVEAQGGEVGVQSTPGHGSVFFAALPRAPGTASVPRVLGSR